VHSPHHRQYKATVPIPMPSVPIPEPSPNQQFFQVFYFNDCKFIFTQSTESILLNKKYIIKLVIDSIMATVSHFTVESMDKQQHQHSAVFGGPPWCGQPGRTPARMPYAICNASLSRSKQMLSSFGS